MENRKYMRTFMTNIEKINREWSHLAFTQMKLIPIIEISHVKYDECCQWRHTQTRHTSIIWVLWFPLLIFKMIMMSCGANYGWRGWKVEKYNFASPQQFIYSQVLLMHTAHVELSIIIFHRVSQHGGHPPPFAASLLNMNSSSQFSFNTFRMSSFLFSSVCLIHIYSKLGQMPHSHFTWIFNIVDIPSRMKGEKKKEISKAKEVAKSI